MTFNLELCSQDSCDEFNELYGPHCWQGQSTALDKFGERIMWMDVMGELGCCVGSTWMSCDIPGGRRPHL